MVDKSGFSEDMLKNLNGKNLKKIMKKVQNDPKMFEMFSNLQRTLLATNSKIDSHAPPSDRVKERLKQCRLQRGGKIRQQYASEKQSEHKIQEDKQKDEVVKSSVQETVVSTIIDVKKQKKKKSDKLKKLKKKYGLITLSQYTESLKKIETTNLPPDEISHHRNIIDLYVSQSETKQEVIIDAEDADTSDGEIVDIDAK
jgi:hypothetical protein